MIKSERVDTKEMFIIVLDISECNEIVAVVKKIAWKRFLAFYDLWLNGLDLTEIRICIKWNAESANIYAYPSASRCTTIHKQYILLR